MKFSFTAEAYSGEETEEEPEIIGTIPNMTVAVGREARIPCKVHNLGTYRVSGECDLTPTHVPIFLIHSMTAIESSRAPERVAGPERRRRRREGGDVHSS